MQEPVEPLYYEVSKRKVYFLRALGLITALIVLLAIIFCIVKGHKKHTLYLCLVNIILSSVVASFLAWWYHKGVLEATTYTFMIFVSLCLIFQAIVIDIYLWNWEAWSSTTNSDIIPDTIAPHTTTTRKPLII